MQSTSRNRAQFCIRGLNLQSPEVLRVMKGNAQSKIQPKHKLQSGWQRSTPWCWVEPQTCTISINFLPPSLLISWVNPLPSRFIDRTILFCNALESHECACCLLSFLYFHWLFPLSASGNRSIYKSTRERVDSKGLYGSCRLHLMCTALQMIPRPDRKWSPMWTANDPRRKITNGTDFVFLAFFLSFFFFFFSN